MRKLGFEEAPDYDFLRDLFTKVLKNHGDTDDELYDWMLLNNGRGLEKRSASASAARHQSQRQQQQPTAAGIRNPTTNNHNNNTANNSNNNTSNNNPYGRSQQPMNLNSTPQQQLQQHDYDDSSRKKGFWKQFISFVTCGLFTCF